MTTDRNEIEQQVRAAVWPWDTPAVPGRPRRMLWVRVAFQLAVMAVLAGLLYWIGHGFVARVICGLAAGVLLLAVFAPTVYDRLEWAFQRFAIWVGHVVTHGLLFPFYMICFVPGHALLRWRNKDPMARTFPAPSASCWRQHKTDTFTNPYRRQY